jgi:hypothetical protein
MSEKAHLQGGVIISYDRRSHGVVELLTAHLRSRIDLMHYVHPNEIEESLDFIIVLSLMDLENVVKTYQAKGEPVPLILHIDSPDAQRDFDYAAHFPYVEIAPIAQGNLAVRDTTLRITLFQEVIEFLEKRLSH